MGNMAYIHGGSGDGQDNIYSDTWEFDLVNLAWTPIAQSSPNPGYRFDHVSAVRPSTGDMYIFGGTVFDPTAATLSSDGYSQQNDVWMLSTTRKTWSLVAAMNASSAAPVARSEAAAVSAGDGAMVVYGGVIIPNNNASPMDLGDLWRFDYRAMTWQQLDKEASGATPPTRFSHAATTITVGNVLYIVVFGGRHIVKNSWNILTDAWMYPLLEGTTSSPSSWTPLNASPPYDRIFSGAVTINSGFWFFGGFNYIDKNQENAVAYSDTIYTSTANLPRLDLRYDYASDVTTISARYNHRMAAWGSNVIVYGGKFQQCYGDLWLRNTSFVPTDPSPYGDDSNVLMPIVALLVAFVVLFAVCSCLIAFLYKRYYHRQMTTQHGHGTRGPNQPRGMSQDEIDAFKVVKFTPTNTADPIEEMCPICLVEYVADLELRELPCSHRYHPACIDEWLKKNHTCPMCKRDMASPVQSPTNAARNPVAETPPTIVIDNELLND
ncbi:Aste57867_11191 [Aphanomyces stellatus]|uniref:Aste57867_11191 protein n=1 Tax=Aphanomyces stellatus TaxID=120398 RepID=A0A485KSB6_9STRA|nr:hypothetical protein As57867_011149 [Aphanomyces stellatus]VFT88058.1 Aste57867_11191 [Aphanomyces stellatus]